MISTSVLYGNLLTSSTQNFTSIKLIHRSACDFLERDSRGQAILQQASMSPTDMRAALSCACDYAARLGLFGLQASFSYDSLCMEINPHGSIYDIAGRPGQIGHISFIYRS